MKTQQLMDLGSLEGPVLVFGGPYSNLPATRALQKTAEDLGLPPEQVICTGDVVAYCAEPAETVRLIRDWGVPVVKGNCEESLAANAPDCGCGFVDGTTCSTLSITWYRYAAAQLAAGDKAWMRRLPDLLHFELAGFKIAVIHGGVSQINRFIFPSASDSDIHEELAKSGCDLLLAGHCGIPFGRRVNGRTWLNAGAIGMPANDGTADGWYLTLTPDEDALRACWHRLRYPAGQARQAMLDAGLGSGYDTALLSGLWPSMDVLPPAERAERGRALNPAELLINRPPPG